MKLKYKVIIVKNSPNEFERLLNDGWGIVQGLGTDATALIVILSKNI